jgi:hypothetical protein
MSHNRICFEGLRKIRKPRLILTESIQRGRNHMLFNQRVSDFGATAGFKLPDKEVQFDFLDVTTEQRVRGNGEKSGGS